MDTNSKEYKIYKFEKILNLIKERNHEFVSGNYENKLSQLEVYCPIHNILHNTNFDNYRRSKTGLPCCGKDSKSKLLTGRVYSPETIEKMRLGARNKPRKPRTNGEWRKTQEFRDWRITVRKDWGYVCAITGKKGDLDTHHLYNGTLYENHRYDPDNGILIDTYYHKIFHDTYGYNKNTLEMFLEFISKLINNQVQLESWKGLETRTYDPERVMESQERLAQLQYKLEVGDEIVRHSDERRRVEDKEPQHN
jgi:ribosomal protein S17E